MVHILEGVVERGTATILRDLDRPMFGKTGTTSGPTNVWFVGGTPDIVAGVYIGYDQPRRMGGMRAGRADRRADLQAIRARSAFKDMPQGAVRRARRDPHGCASTAPAGAACSAPSRPPRTPSRRSSGKRSSRRPSRAARSAAAGARGRAEPPRTAPARQRDRRAAGADRGPPQRGSLATAGRSQPAPAPAQSLAKAADH